MGRGWNPMAGFSITSSQCYIQYSLRYHQIALWAQTSIWPK